MATINVQGTITVLGELKSGKSAKGFEWARQDIVLAIPSGNPKYVDHLAVKVSNERLEEIAGLKVGDTVSMTVGVSSREWQGKWYTDVECWSVDSPKSVPAPRTTEPAFDPDMFKNTDGDMPF